VQIGFPPQVTVHVLNVSEQSDRASALTPLSNETMISPHNIMHMANDLKMHFAIGTLLINSPFLNLTMTIAQLQWSSR